MSVKDLPLKGPKGGVGRPVSSFAKDTPRARPVKRAPAGAPSLTGLRARGLDWRTRRDWPAA